MPPTQNASRPQLLSHCAAVLGVAADVPAGVSALELPQAADAVLGRAGTRADRRSGREVVAAVGRGRIVGRRGVLACIAAAGVTCLRHAHGFEALLATATAEVTATAVVLVEGEIEAAASAALEPRLALETDQRAATTSQSATTPSRAAMKRTEASKRALGRASRK